MKELFAYISGLAGLAGYLFAFAVLGSIAIIAYHFYPTVTVIVLTLMAIGWIMEWFKRYKNPKNS